MRRGLEHRSWAKNGSGLDHTKPEEHSWQDWRAGTRQTVGQCQPGCVKSWGFRSDHFYRFKDMYKTGRDLALVWT